MSENPKRSWPRFSLRFALLVMAGVSAALGYSTWKAKALREQSQTILQLERLGAIVSFEHELNRPAPVQAPGPKWLRRILGEYSFGKVRQIQADGDWVTDDVVRLAATVPGVRSLIFRSNSITDQGLTHLGTVGELDALEIISQTVTGAGIGQLKDIRIKLLILSKDRSTGRNIDDSWMPEIAKLARVNDLCLNGARITDQGLAHLDGATGLRVLYLSHTRTTDEGVKKLQLALPNCKIVRR